MCNVYGQVTMFVDSSFENDPVPGWRVIKYAVHAQELPCILRLVSDYHMLRGSECDLTCPKNGFPPRKIDLGLGTNPRFLDR